MSPPADTSMQIIAPEDLVILEPDPMLTIDLAYARSDHPDNLFGTAFYRTEAPCVLHRRLAAIVTLAARTLHVSDGWTLVIKDALRPVEAQQAILDSAAVRAHPAWMEGKNRMFARPGGGGHPRGMAVDVEARDSEGRPVDFGTRFDAMPDPITGINPAHRNFTAFSGDPTRALLILENRQKLTQSFLDAAVDAGEALWPLPHEWWDYRLPPFVYERFAPLKDADLPEHLHLMPR